MNSLLSGLLAVIIFMQVNTISHLYESSLFMREHLFDLDLALEEVAYDKQVIISNLETLDKNPEEILEYLAYKQFNRTKVS